jgi:branched-subunit amino acid ABC-type transport system permease component
VIISVTVGVLFGGLAERVLIRPLYGKPEINAIVVMVGFLGLIEAFVAGIWTSVTRNIPPPFSQIFFQAHGQVILLSPFVIFQICAGHRIMLIARPCFDSPNSACSYERRRSRPKSLVCSACA